MQTIAQESAAPKPAQKWRPDPARRFVRDTVTVADDLARRYQRSGIFAELDAQVLLCAVLGALCSRCWPKASDSKRFVELLVRYSHVEPSVRTTSIPTLIDRFPNDQGLKSLDPSIDESQVLFSEDIDRTDRVVKSQCPNLELKDIRSASYANFIYKYLRCGLLHEYAIKGRLTSDGWVNYGRLHYSHFSSERDERGKRLLYMPYSYLRSIVLTTTSRLCSEWENSADWKLDVKQPGTWWLDP